MYSFIDQQKLARTYREGLLLDTIPFWTKHCVDNQHGGFVFNLNRDGSWIDTDKSIWIHARFTWLLATLYATVEKKEEWLSLAQHGMAFLETYGFDKDGRMFFSVNQMGSPLRKRRYIFSETFMIIAYAAMAKATGEQVWVDKAEQLFQKILDYLSTPGILPPKVDPITRPSKGLAVPMILITTAQTLREVSNQPICTQTIDGRIAEIQRDFMHAEVEGVLECVGPQGEFLDTFDGRLLNPGHAIEAAWFILHEARIRNNDPDLRKLGLKILDWSWQWGWDTEHGGILYFRDAKGLPPTEYWHDMKFWWPQNEAIIATLLAWKLSDEPSYASKHKMVHEWAHSRFPDPEFGEWYGYLHRDGRLSTSLKGNMWKGPFHLPRMQWYCWQLLSDSLVSVPQSE